MYVIKARTHGCVRNDSETHSTGVTGLLLDKDRFSMWTLIIKIPRSLYHLDGLVQDCSISIVNTGDDSILH